MPEGRTPTGYTGHLLDLEQRTITVHWKGEPDDVVRGILAKAEKFYQVEFVPADYSLFELCSAGKEVTDYVRGHPEQFPGLWIEAYPPSNTGDKITFFYSVRDESRVADDKARISELSAVPNDFHESGELTLAVGRQDETLKAVVYASSTTGAWITAQGDSGGSVYFTEANGDRVARGIISAMYDSTACPSTSVFPRSHPYVGQECAKNVLYHGGKTVAANLGGEGMTILTSG